jgi:hypothetical protein
MRKAFLLTGLIVGCTSPALASPSPALPGAPLIYQPPSAMPPPRIDRAFETLRSEIIDLRQRALALRASDGGKLTSEHRDTIQAQIDEAYRRYRSARR